jgi:hypothetical protein
MKELITKWRFWIGFQFLLIIILNIIGHLREGNGLIEIFGYGSGMTLAGFIGTILGFPLGIYFLLVVRARLIDVGVWIYVLPAIYYPLFFTLVWYITKQKRKWKFLAIILILFMLLSFGGCSKVVEIPLQIT